MKQKPDLLFLSKLREEMEGDSEPGSTPGGTAQALAAPPYGEASWPHL
jgi:hypothetical protein